MSLKSILVHIDDAESWGGRLEAAARLAREFGAQLTGVYLVATFEVSPSLAALLPADIVEQWLRETGRHAESAFHKAAVAAGVASVEWRAPAGPPFEAAVAHGRCADLFIMGQHEPGTLGSDFAGS
ncbi:MAG: universal stress protein [Casimicrobiaceae bacterium]